MTHIPTLPEERNDLTAVLDQAASEGEVRVRRPDGRVFVIRPLGPERSPLDVRGVGINLTVDEILDFITEGRREPNGE